MFGAFLLDEGVEMELDADLREVLAVIDREVPTFSCDNYGFQVNVTRGVVGSQWRFLVNPVDKEAGKAIDAPVGFVIVTREQDGTTSFQVPPRSEWGTPQGRTIDADGRLFTAFIFQILETFQRLGWIDLPGPLPEQ